jgi:cell division protein FtsW (lipid II flippase)
MTTTMFVLSTMFWIASVVITFLIINVYNGSSRNSSNNWLPMFSAILLVNVSTVLVPYIAPRIVREHSLWANRLPEF